MKTRRKQTIGQISYFDMLSANVKLGRTSKEHIGSMIPFKDLDEYYGKKIVLESANNDASKCKEKSPEHKVVMVTTYHDKHKGKKDPVADGYGAKGNTVGYICNESQKKVWDSKKSRMEHKQKEQTWLRESACRNGRYKESSENHFCFYEYEV